MTKNNTLGAWAEEHKTTVQEIEILIRADARPKHSNILQWAKNNPLHEYAMEEDTITYIRNLLSAARSGAMKIALGHIHAALAGTMGAKYSVERIANLISSAKDNRYHDAITAPSHGTGFTGMAAIEIRSKSLPTLLADIAADVTYNQDMAEKPAETPDGKKEQPVSTDNADVTKSEENAPMPASAPDSHAKEPKEPAPAVKTPAKAPAKKPTKKKTKYSTTKQILTELFSAGPSTLENDTKQARMFLMTKGQHTVQEIAIMTDKEVIDSFTSKYRSIQFPQGTLVIPTESFSDIMDTLSNAETYFIPGEKPAEEE